MPMHHTALTFVATEETGRGASADVSALSWAMLAACHAVWRATSRSMHPNTKNSVARGLGRDHERKASLQRYELDSS